MTITNKLPFQNPGSLEASQAKEVVDSIDEIRREHLSPRTLCPDLCATQNLFTAFWISNFAFNASANPSQGSNNAGFLFAICIFGAIAFGIKTAVEAQETKKNHHLYAQAMEKSTPSSSDNVQEVYKKTLPFLKRQLVNSYLKTALAFTVFAGFSLLTSAIVMASLTGHSYLVSPEFLALLGTGVIGAGAIGFTIKNTTIYCLSFTDQRIRESQELYEALHRLSRDFELTPIEKTQ